MPFHQPGPRAIYGSRPQPTFPKLDQVMKDHVLKVYRELSGNKLATAAALGISRSKLYCMLGEWGIS